MRDIDMIAGSWQYTQFIGYIPRCYVFQLRVLLDLKSTEVYSVIIKGFSQMIKS